MNSLNHIAIIMDGNGRWAKKKNKPRNYGHKKGLNNIPNIIKFCKRNKIKNLTLFVFSYDNWKRSDKEISYLFALIDNYLIKKLNFLLTNKIRINFIGEKKKITKKLIKTINKIKKDTSKSYDITVNLAFNYSSKLEIINSINQIIKNKKTNKIKNISIKLFESFLYTKNIPDPDIIIRTGGHNRLSDFLLWQSAYSEIFFINKLWPDFLVIDLKKIVKKFLNTKRNFGGIDE